MHPANAPKRDGATLTSDPCGPKTSSIGRSHRDAEPQTPGRPAESVAAFQQELRGICARTDVWQEPACIYFRARRSPGNCGFESSQKTWGAGGAFSFSPKLSPPCPDPRRILHSSSSATTQARGLIRNPASDETRARLAYDKEAKRKVSLHARGSSHCLSLAPISPRKKLTSSQ